MDRVSPAFKRRRFQLGIAALCLGLAFLAGTCDNPVDLLGEVEVKVMKANDRYLEVEDIDAQRMALGSELVSPGAELVIVFDRNVNPGSLDSVSIIKSGVAAPITFTLESNVLRIIEDPFFDNDTAYFLSLSGVAGTDGSRLSAPVVWSFRTGTAPAGSLNLANPGSDAGYANDLSINAILSLNTETDYYKLLDAAPSAGDYGADGWTATSGSTSISTTKSLPAGADGARAVYMLLKNDASPATFSAVIQKQIILDSTAPAAGAWTLASGAVAISTAAVSVHQALSPSDGLSGVIYSQFSNNGATWSALEGVPPVKAWDLVSGSGGTAAEGPRTVYVRVRDRAGNYSPSVNDAIIYDTTPPFAPTVSGESVTLDNTPSWTWASGGGGGGTSYRYQLDSESGAWVGPTATTALTSGTLSDGLHTLYVQQKDATWDYFSSSGARATRVTPAIPYVGQDRVSKTPALSWRPYGMFIGSYVVQFASSSRGPWTDVANTAQEEQYTVPTALRAYTTVYWRIRVDMKIDDYIPSSGSYYFTTGK